MRTATLRRLAVPALAVVFLLAGCSDDGDDDTADDPTTTTTTAAGDDEATTTEAEGEGDEATTTEAADGASTTEGGSDGGSPDAPPDTSIQDQEGTGAPDAEAPDVSWDLDAAQYRGQDGDRIAFLCPPDGDATASVWGTKTYTDDSSVCAAAVHAGLINTVEGGRVIIEIAPGEDAYQGTEANGVTSQDYGAWQGSFTFPVG